MNNKITSVIDTPRKAGQADLFGIDRYNEALVEFIETSSTPITIAIQGEWGSGKTSLMNTLKDELCDQEGKSFFPIWLNTWQFSLMKSEEETLIAIINGLTNEIADIATAKDSSLAKLANQSLGILGRIAGASAKVAIKVATGQDVGEVVDAFSGDARETTILKLRDSLNELISKIIEQSDKDGFLFFIDDLDRIDPPVAVNILELLKNIFDLNNCAFILAIDYDVVVKGLEPKFGKLTDKNEREFRSFFDKIIQLPFSMPVSSYNIDVFLSKTLGEINYKPSDDNDSEAFYENLTDIAYNSVGSNPRSLKRLVNTLSLISIINKRTGLESNQTDIDKQVNFALVCVQVAYPSIYKSITIDPNFTSWNQETARRFKLRELEEHEIKSLEKSTEFDEEWEQILYRICEKDSYLASRVFNISLLLNKISDFAREEAELGDYLAEILEQSSVTDVQAGDNKKIAKIKKGDYLKVIRNKIIPVLKEKSTDQSYKVKQQGKRIVSNLFLKFSKHDWEPYVTYELRPDRTKPFIDVGAVLHVCDTEGSDLVESIKAANKSEQVDEVIQYFKKKLAQYKNDNDNIEFWRDPDSTKFYKIRPKKHVQIFPYFRIYFNNIEEIVTDKFISVMADMSMVIIKSYKIINNGKSCRKE